MHIAMMIASWILAKFEVSLIVEAGFQNFVAGLILAHSLTEICPSLVAAELFPLMLEESKTDSMVGITIGFVVGLALLHGLEGLIEYIEDLSLSTSSHDDDKDRSSPTDYQIMKTLPEGFLHLDDGNQDVEAGLALTSNYSPMASHKEYVNWNDESIKVSSKAFEQPDHRNHILEHMKEVSQQIIHMESESNRLLEDEKISPHEVEEIAERIDENIHGLQYKLDHCRRLLQGSEANISGELSKSWVTEERKVLMKQRLRNLKLTVDHVIDHINESQVDISLLKEIHGKLAPLTDE